jgi:hypothetical protein
MTKLRCVASIVVGVGYLGRCDHPAKTTRPLPIAFASKSTLDLPVCGVHARRHDDGKRSIFLSSDVRDVLVGGAS